MGPRLCRPGQSIRTGHTFRDQGCRPFFFFFFLVNNFGSRYFSHLFTHGLEQVIRNGGGRVREGFVRVRLHAVDADIVDLVL